MIISKHIHSCLLIEENNKVFLIDPGNYTYEEGGLNLDKLTKLDYILITHEHPDHMYLPFIKDIINKFPNVKIISSDSVVSILKKESIDASSDADVGISFKESPHEEVFGIIPPKNIVFTLFNKIVHPGDSLQFKKTVEVLALPVQAPWCSLTQSVAYALLLKPRYIIPIHDWHWNEKAREAFYQRLVKYFSDREIEFKSLKTGEKVSFR